jgi:hypothetical protein
MCSEHNLHPGAGYQITLLIIVYFFEQTEENDLRKPLRGYILPKDIPDAPYYADFEKFR